MSLPYPQGFEIDCGRGVHGKEWAQNRDEILLCLRLAHRLGKTAERHAEKFLNHLIADDSLTGVRRSADEVSRLFRLRGGVRVEGINKDVGIEEESTAHSSLPACKDRTSAHAGGVASAHPLRLRLLPVRHTVLATRE